MTNKITKVELIYQDENLIAVNKPSGISVTKDRSGKADLLMILEKQLGLKAHDELRLIHRLDKATSGIIIIAKNIETQSLYSSLFEKREIKKTYLAIVQGYCHKDKGSIKTPISQSRKNPGTMIVDPRRGKSAVTQWELLADFGLVSLVKAQPLTGRTHQIRLHLKSIGLPLAIDPVYGADEPIMLSDFKPKYRPKKWKEEKPLIDRLTLHAYQISLPETATSPAMTFVAGLDKNYAAALKMLTKHNPKGEGAFKDIECLDKIINKSIL